MGSADGDGRGADAGGGISNGSNWGQRPAPLSQWEAFKRALVSEEHFDTCYWLQVGRPVRLGVGVCMYVCT